VTRPLREAVVSPAASSNAAPYPGWIRWPFAVLRTARPRQWPKNLLVFAAPLAGASLGRRDGLAYALVAAAAFCAASVAVYMVNDVVDADRDRRHPVKRRRPIAAGELPKSHAVAVAGVCIVAALSAGFAIRTPLLSAIVGGYVASSMLYSLVLKHIPVI
jgi:decaprenyl-phosphate phosphoribosyltransferase